MLPPRTGNMSVNAMGSGYVGFSTLAREKLRMRPQEAGQYIEGRGQDIPELGKELRWLGNTRDYDHLRIHADDADTFVKRVNQHVENKQEAERQEKMTKEIQKSRGF